MASDGIERWRRFRRRALDTALGMIALAALGGLVATLWIGRFPRSDVAERAATLPVIGTFVERVRTASEAEARARRGAARPAAERPPRRSQVAVPVPGAASSRSVDSAIPWPGERAWVDVLAGSVAYDRPSLEAPQRWVAETTRTLPRFERRGPWFRVWAHGAEAWVHLPGHLPDGVAGAPYGDAPTAPGPLPGRVPDDDRLALACSLLAGNAPCALDRRLGPYRAVTDLPVGDDGAAGILWRRLDGVARGLEATYAKTFGLAPIDRPRAAVVVFAREADYRDLEGRTERIAHLHSSGHHARGVVALYAGDLVEDEVASTLAHELTHLLARRALGPALPPWLDEGMAELVASSAIDAEGSLDPTRLGGRHRRVAIAGGERVVVQGPLAGAVVLRELALEDRLPSLRVALDRPWDEFVGSVDRGTPGVGPVASAAARRRYDLAGWWLRFLFETARADATRAFLRSVAAGEDASLEALRARLGETWPALDQAYRDFVLERTASLPSAGSTSPASASTVSAPRRNGSGR
ncbi:MAG: hypothetical protein AAGN46_15315 [Acidobacteriota bacterium]